MKVYWQDREGNHPPSDCTFHFLSFDAKTYISSQGEQVTLPPAETVRVVKKTFLPDKVQWDQNVKKILGENITKVVLARSCTLELEKSPDPFAIAASLQALAKNSFVFCIQFDDFAFLGATPERLFKRMGKNLQSEAMAGTNKRGSTKTEDLLLQNELLSNPKALREIEPVKEYLQNILSPFCQTPPLFTPYSIHQTSNVHHLYSLCKMDLKQDVNDLDLLRKIHPTPALCGTPPQRAFSLIEEIEPFNRGFYGGALGWQHNEESEWIVGIRSCLLKNNRAILYSGTGIVEGSTPDEEWDELNEKLNIYSSIFI